MKTSVQNKSSGFTRSILAILVAVALLAIALPASAAYPDLSGGATVFDYVTVKYSSGSNTINAYASVGVTINTIASLPVVTYPAGQTVLTGSAPSPAYTYSIRSTSNGLDTWTTSGLTDAASGVLPATFATLTSSFTLWAGYITGAGNGYINVPAGTTTGLTVNSSTVYVTATAGTYTVTNISGGSPATYVGGVYTPEVYAQLTLSPISGPAITATNATVGTQVGEFKASAVTHSFTAAAPTAVGTDGKYQSQFTLTSTVNPSLNLVTTNVQTVVPSPQVTIAKTSLSGSTVNSGGTINYQIVVTNTSTSYSVTTVTVTDPVTLPYVTYVLGSTKLNGNSVADVSNASQLTPTNGGIVIPTLSAGANATITYSVTVN